MVDYLTLNFEQFLNYFGEFALRKLIPAANHEADQLNIGFGYLTFVFHIINGFQIPVYRIYFFLYVVDPCCCCGRQANI